MGASNQAVTSLAKNKYTIPSKSHFTVNFMGAKPNYYRITNGGSSNLYLGVSMTPSKSFFDMMIPSASTKVFVDAYGHENIYLYNPSTEPANIILTSFESDFNPVVLAMTDFGQDFSSIEINANTLITGFEAPLPSGNNEIGIVGLKQTDLTAIIEAIQNLVIENRTGFENVVNSNTTNKAKSINSKSLNFAFFEDENLNAEYYGTSMMKITAPEGYYFSYVANHTGQNRKVYIVNELATIVSMTVEEYNSSGIKASELIIDNMNNVSDIKTIITQI